jgi:hypothetical protein
VNPLRPRRRDLGDERPGYSAASAQVAQDDEQKHTLQEPAVLPHDLARVVPCETLKRRRRVHYRMIVLANVLEVKSG